MELWEVLGRWEEKVIWGVEGRSLFSLLQTIVESEEGEYGTFVHLRKTFVHGEESLIGRASIVVSCCCLQLLGSEASPFGCCQDLKMKGVLVLKSRFEMHGCSKLSSGGLVEHVGLTLSSQVVSTEIHKNYLVRFDLFLEALK